MAGNRTGDFGQALEALKAGSLLAREGWNGKGQYIYLHSPDGQALMGDFIAICPVGGQHMPWVASQTDLLADDWFVVGGARP